VKAGPEKDRFNRRGRNFDAGGLEKTPFTCGKRAENFIIANYCDRQSSFHAYGNRFPLFVRQ